MTLRYHLNHIAIALGLQLHIPKFKQKLSFLSHLSYSVNRKTYIIAAILKPFNSTSKDRSQFKLPFLIVWISTRIPGANN